MSIDVLRGLCHLLRNIFILWFLKINEEMNYRYFIYFFFFT